MTNYTFKNMQSWTVKRLREERLKLREELAEEIHKRDAMKAEIMYLQKEIAEYQDV